MDLNWKLISQEPYSAGRRKMLRRLYELPDGRREIFDIRDEGPSVSILALTPNRKVILARQFRPGPGKVVSDLPCGMIERGESPFDAAARELLEETGFAGTLHSTGTCLEDAYSTKIRHNFVALNCKRVSKQKLDATEFIEVEIVDSGSFKKMLRNGELTVVETGYFGLEYLN